MASMEVFMQSSSFKKTCLIPRNISHKQRVIPKSRICYLISSNGCPSNSPSGLFSTQKHSVQVNKCRGRELVVTGAKNKKKKKEDSHSFVSKPDEATGPFPEAVLLKERCVKFQKKVQGDGRILPEFEDAEEEKLFDFLNLQLESDLNLERMRHYEVVYLIHEDCIEEVGSVNSKIEEFIKEKKGRIWRVNDWGLRRLAYKIQKARNAHYMLMNFEMEAKLINDFKTLLDKDERVIRHLVIKRDEAITKDFPSPLEFHTLRADMDGNDDDEDMDDDKDFDDDDDDDIIIIDEEDNGENSRSVESVVTIGGKKVYA
ncbi:hypothetical protein GIB67_001445 [Kingdonia uniflora]|uniref:30S ribosomal protein S6 n=1 Tax=Kingdonia uniflora TaxID=39325 RepID=A0A7J7L6M6_9MAGN|nr:hypothetical protein GIB67_001445 [Kingdonia uniflora]